MTETQEWILCQYIPEYKDTVDKIMVYSDYELNLAINNNLPDNIDDLPQCIANNIQWDILSSLCYLFIDNWDEFYKQEEYLIMDYCDQGSILNYNSYNKSYEICKNDVIRFLEDIISEAVGHYTINKEVDFTKIIADLNKSYPVKFCEIR